VTLLSWPRSPGSFLHTSRRSFGDVVPTGIAHAFGRKDLSRTGKPLVEPFGELLALPQEGVPARLAPRRIQETFAAHTARRPINLIAETANRLVHREREDRPA
jgi:hypothetical protein